VSSAPAPQFEPVPPSESNEGIEVEKPGQEAAQPESEAAQEDAEPAYEYPSVIHLTRTWVQYGVFGFAVLCILIGAVEALFGK